MEIRRAASFVVLVSCAFLAAQDQREILPVGFAKKGPPDLSLPPLGTPPGRLPILDQKTVPVKDAAKKDAVKDDLPEAKEFDGRLVQTTFKDSHWLVMAGKDVLRDCGVDRIQAETVAKVVRDSRFSHRGEIPGANPPFEFWLTSFPNPTTGKPALSAAEMTAGSTTLQGIDVTSLKVERIAGAWCVRDSRQVLFNFGPREENAKLALAVMDKYGFNAMGRIGQPQPIMTYMMKGPYRKLEAVKSPRAASAVNGERFLADGYYVPDLGNVGHRKAIDFRNLKLVKGREWQLLSGSELIAQFGTDEGAGRNMLKAFEDWRINEYVEVGEAGFRVYMAGGQAPHGAPFQGKTVDFHGATLKVEKRDDRYWLMAGRTEVYDCGKSEDDAKRMLAVVKQMHGEKLVTLGSPKYGEWKFFVRGW